MSDAAVKAACMWERFYEAFRKAVEESPLNQREIAKAAGVNESTISRIKNGSLAPADSTVQRLEAALGVKNAALSTLAYAARTEPGPVSASQHQQPGLDGGFTVPHVLEHIDCTLFLDRSMARAEEIRHIRALAPGCTTFAHGVGYLPLFERVSPPNMRIVAREGARLRQVKQPVRDYIVAHLEFAEPLPTDRAHRFRVSRYVRGGMRPFYTCTPVYETRRFTLRVQFNPEQVPNIIQLVDREPPEMARELREGREQLYPDRFGLLELKPFESLSNGWAYGVAWSQVR